MNYQIIYIEARSGVRHHLKNATKSLGYATYEGGIKSERAVRTSPRKIRRKVRKNGRRGANFLGHTMAITGKGLGALGNVMQRGGNTITDSEWVRVPKQGTALTNK